ncbi:esterase FE4-like [Anticarsia gemmatalis]|uniref:esterase FE4-like n=1 Tax=Anticarsia gemmatalis TaxID=129554 RepID=UPI003F761783
MSETVVEITQGKIKGKLTKNYSDFEYYTFKGIPYAKPPIGDLRFTVPQPAESWEGIRDGTKTCNICAQYDRQTNTVIGDEDCLYLNVYTPKLPTTGSELAPVMVFFHGGGFLFGHGTDDAAHGPDYLIEKNVVIVSLNHRLGILGFLCLDRKDAPGNMGLMDQVVALKWVQKNIANFGGNPGNVTIFGVSAGAASVEYLLLSPMAKGLFHKAIAQSGSSLLHWAHNEDVKKLALKIPTQEGKTVADDDQLLKYLKTLSTSELIFASMKALSTDKFKGGIHFGFVPTVEKPGDWEPFLAKPPYQLLSQGEFARVPYITGCCTREGLLMVSHGAPRLEQFVKEKSFVDYFPFDIDSTERENIELKLKQNYLEGEKLYKDDDAYAIDFFTDADFFGGVYVAAKLIAKRNPVYFFEFSYDGNLNYIKKCHNIEREGACHGDDGGYIIKSDKMTAPVTDTDKVIRNVMNTLWTNFAKYGNPTPVTDDVITTKWEPVAEQGVSCLVIDKTLKMKHELYPQRMKLYEEIYGNKYGSK